MAYNVAKILSFGLIIAIGIGLTATSGHSEIKGPLKGKRPKLAKTVKGAAGKKVVKKYDAPLRVQCWQHGVKIIDEKGVRDIRLQNVINRATIGFKGRNSKRGEIYVIPVNDDSTCLIKPLR